MLSSRKTFFAVTLVVLSLFMLGTANVAMADATYTYTGLDFTNFYNGSYHPSIVCSPLCNVTGSFTVSSALGDNLSNVTVSPVSYSFTDGLSTNTNTNSTVNQFLVSTDAAGNITAWTIYTQINPSHTPCSNNEYTVYTSTTEDFGEISGDLCTSPYDQYAYNHAGGTWTSDVVATATPEPGSLALLGSGLIGLAGGVRRKFMA